MMHKKWAPCSVLVCEVKLLEVWDSFIWTSPLSLVSGKRDEEKKQLLYVNGFHTSQELELHFGQRQSS